MDEILKYCGVLFICVVGLSLLALLYFVADELIRTARYNYRIKHRFDKPPLAKCYCIDCRYRAELGRCKRDNLNHKADNWFCADAEKKPCE